MTLQRDSVPGARDQPSAASQPDGSAGVARQPDETGPDAAATIADLRARAEFLEGEWRRALADADNLRKRFERDTERIRAEERANAARQWLPVVDDLERALEHAEADPRAIVDGVRAIRDEAVSLLARVGFPRRDDRGKPFDPARHDAVGSRPDPGAQPGTVLDVVRPAYGDGDKQLRPALVVVAKDG